MLLDRIQVHLEAIYGTRCELKVTDFLVGEHAISALGGGDGEGRESLFVREDDDALELKLFISPKLLERLENESLPAAASSDPRGFYEALEGVSHFLYLCRTAELDRQVSMLELEAQAEVDKFAAGALLKWHDGVAGARALHAQLFEHVSYAPQWGDDERWRYEEANRLAKGYCSVLLKLIAARRLDLLLSELRHSYRMGAEAKLKHLTHGGHP